jgi:putative membrane protein
MIKFFRLSLLTDDLFKRFVEKELNLNDQLAAIRSILASERTFLAYQRTALATFAAGLTLLQFFNSFWFQIIGWLLIPIAIFTISIGFVRYRKTRRYIFKLEKDFVKEARNHH